ncbi:MAG: TVP38/TMEM64 family protein [Acidobacteria bacterium]|nr:TVP38/TMEM64 family protein [Acidobacteriota bacterium]
MTKRRIALVGLLVAGAATAAYALPVAGWITAIAARARNTGPLGVAMFFAAYVISTVAFLPGSILTLAAGFAFGPFWGLAVASPASVCGATCAFLLGRTLLRDWAAARVGRSPRLKAVDGAIGREAFKIVVLLRLSPLFPFNVLNYALSLTQVRLRTYVLASFLGMLPGTALYVYLGALAPAAAELSSAGGGGGSARMVLYVGGLAATAAAATIAARAARAALKASLQETA